MYDNYYACTDTSFFILDMNVEKEYLLKNNKVVYVGSTPLIIPDALNQLIRVDDVTYITAGFTNGKGVNIFYIMTGSILILVNIQICL